MTNIVRSVNFRQHVEQARGEWSSGLRRFDENWKVPGSNPARRSAWLRDPTLL